MDWDEWGQRLSEILCPEGKGRFQSLFAKGALFSDPVNEPTTDLAAIEAMTESSFPDWRQEIHAVHGDNEGGVFEWTGTGTLGGTTPVVIHGCTVVDVDSEGLVVRWRDYFDLNEIDRQAGHHGSEPTDESGIISR